MQSFKYLHLDKTRTFFIRSYGHSTRKGSWTNGFIYCMVTTVRFLNAQRGKTIETLIFKALINDIAYLVLSY